MTEVQIPRPRENDRQDQLTSQYREIGPGAILAAALSMVRKRPQMKLSPIVQETD